MVLFAQNPGSVASWRLFPPSSTVLEDPSRHAALLLGTGRILHALEQPIAFEVVVSKGTRRLLLSCSRSGAAHLERVLRPIYRNWGLEPTVYVPPGKALLSGSVAELVPAGLAPQGPFPSQSLLRESILPVWEGILSADLGGDWNFHLKVILTPHGGSRPPSVSSEVRRTVDLPSHTPGRQLLDQRAERTMDQLWTVGGAVLLWSDPGKSSQAEEELQHRRLLTRLVESLTTQPGGSGFTLKWPRTRWGRRQILERHVSARFVSERERLWRKAGVLSTPETMAWFPTATESFPPLRKGIADRSGLVLGSDPLGTEVALPWNRAEGHHLLVAGETGMGKSTLLVRLAARVLGPDTALIVFDPLGDTVADLLESLDPSRLARALWISPGSSPVAQNALQFDFDPDPRAASLQRERLVGELVTAFRRVRAERYGETFYWGPRIEDLLTRIFLYLSYRKGTTLSDAVAILEDPRAAGTYLSSEPSEERESRELLERLQRERPEDMEGARRVLSEVTLSPSLAEILASRNPRWDLSQALQPGNITLLSMDRAQIGGRGASYLGSLMLSLVWSRIVSRKGPRGKVVLLLDEIQEYANESLIEMLRLGRRYGLHVWAATQSVSGLPKEARDALLTNARDLVLFRGSPSDARFAREELGLPPEESLLSLGKGEVVAFLGKAGSAVRVRTLPPQTSPRADPERPSPRRDQVRENSKAFWSRGQEAAPKGPPETAPAGARSPTEELLSVLKASLCSMPGEELTVSLAYIRELAQGDEVLVRELGRELSRQGVLVRSQREGGARVWVLSRHGLENLPCEFDPAPQGSPAARTQKSTETGLPEG